MANFLSSFLEPFRRRKGLVVCLVILSLIAIVLAVLAAINFNGSIIPINLSNISYMEYLKGEYGFVSMLFASLFGVALFFSIVFVCCSKKFLLPLAILFYLYYVYTQAVVFTSVILIYGFFNVIILSLILLVYLFLTFFLFLVLIASLIEQTNNAYYFKCGLKESNALLILLAMLVLTFVFCFILSIMKSYIIILVY